LKDSLNGGFLLPLCNHCPTVDTRREVLNAITMKGSSHVIAEQAATGAQRHLQDLEWRVTVEALLTGEGDVGKDIQRLMLRI
jgi:hypothetical protein